MKYWLLRSIDDKSINWKLSPSSPKSVVVKADTEDEARQTATKKYTQDIPARKNTITNNDHPLNPWQDSTTVECQEVAMLTAN